MSEDLNVSIVASLIADPVRSAMLAALLDGRAVPAGELALAAGVTPQTASAHLSKLLRGDLVAVEKEGRHRYYRLAGPDVAEALERLAAIKRQQPVRRPVLSPQARKLRFARCCYKHLAGHLGVALAQGLQEHGFLIAVPDKRFEITPAGAERFADIGLDVCALKPTKRGLARQCLDWTQRHHHVAGPLGDALLRTFYARDWLRRSKDSRLIRVTPVGTRELRRQLGVHLIRTSGS